MMRILRCIACAALAATGPVAAAPVMMSADWARDACAAWNADATLTRELHASGWATNHKNRGEKVLRIARADCKASRLVELHIAPRDGKAQCIAGEPASAAALDYDVDYLMTAETRRWLEMGRGEYGPMRAMMFGRLSFDGPMGEAMGNMGPFGSFLMLVGKVPGDAGTCPP